LQQIIDNCDAGDAGMDKCPGLIGGLNDPSDSCNIECPISETILGTMDALPGNNPLGSWGAAPTGGSTSASSAAAVESLTPATSAAPSKSSTPAAPATSAAAPVKGSSAASVESLAAGAKEVSTPTVAKTVAPAESSTPVATVPTVVATPITVPNGGSGGSNTLTTSYISETTVIWTTVTAPAASSTPTSSSSVANGWSYYGCYSDKLGNGNRVMAGLEFADIGNHEVTNTKCVAYCDAKGFSMAGTEYGGQCFCANTLNTGTSNLDESICDMACEGDDSETCGGSLALSVYSKSSANARRLHNRHLHQHIRGVSN
jgi:hypothetical protein